MNEFCGQVDGIQRGSAEVAALLNSMSAAARDEARGMEQIAKAMEDINAVVQRNASDADTGRTAADNLDERAAALQSIVAQLAAMMARSQSAAVAAPEALILRSPLS